MGSVKELYYVLKFIWGHPMNADHRALSLIKFFCWQVAIRFLKVKVIVPWVEDSKFITGIGESGVTGNLYGGFMEYQDMAFLLHALQPDEIFVDVGANIGAYTILASKVVKSRTVAFEPIPETAQRLKEQTRINNIDDMVDIRNIGIGNKKEKLWFTANSDTVNKVILNAENGNATSVEVSTLDVELNEDARYFLKIDVEGFEFNVIEGANTLLSSGKIAALIIELNGSGEEFGHSNDKIHKKIVSFDYDPVDYDPIKRKITKLDSYNKARGNTIYVRNSARVEELCKAAPFRVVHTANGARI